MSKLVLVTMVIIITNQSNLICSSLSHHCKVGLSKISLVTMGPFLTGESPGTSL